ncbi:hypothetical protein JCM19046_4066 [Bacillus sp. JCM 19046]|nr:hypothetical protein JCM19045_2832 [Bacillus sp. JCM 19045]GAF19417.1 hypothetical protein JCM19046_4066 [Bacillus sp. JCM 19046]
MSDSSAKMKAFAQRIQEGIGLIKQGDYQSGYEQLKPYVVLMKEAGSIPVRLFSYYAIAQFKQGDIDGFLETYESLKAIEPSDKEEEKAIATIEEWFHALMNEMGQRD